MCGRFINLTKTSSIKKKFNISDLITKDVISYNISPSQISCIVFKKKEIKIDIARWGYSYIDKNINHEKNVINSRLETIKDKIIFKESYSKRKCIIPINGYYEWSLIENKKKPFFIHVPQFEPIYLAGIWKYSNFPINDKKVFTIITKNANKKLINIHHRMPVILSTEESEKYIDDDKCIFLQNNFSSSIEEDLDFYEVSKFVNNPHNDSNECIQDI